MKMPEQIENEYWNVNKLDLDPLNPRLPIEMHGATQDELFVYFIDYYGLEELAWSMAENGYWSEEPLLTIASSSDPTRRIVVEGNRRLSAIKLLTDPHARSLSRNVLFWQELSELTLDDHDLLTIPTRKYENRESLLDYLGFRHVSGLLPWKADAKARYIHSLITEHGYTFERAARVIGSRKDTICRNFLAWASIEQARSAGVVTESAELRFGVYYRALQNPRTRTFLQFEGWEDGTETQTHPLGGEGVSRLEEFLGYVFGSRKVIKDSRQLDVLASVLNDSLALQILRTERNLELSIRARPVDREGLDAELRLAYRHAASAHAESFRFAGDADLIRSVDQLIEIATRIRHSLLNDGVTT
jgi:hypothetical protein